MNKETKDLHIAKMVENLTVFRAKLGLTQAELAKIAGISRQTILSIEKQQRGMTWNMFLSLLYIFKTNEKTAPMVELFDIETDELKAFISK